MAPNTSVAFIILAGKMLELEDELFQNKKSFLKRFLTGMGLFKINITELKLKNEHLLNKYYEVYKNIPEKELEDLGNFPNLLEESLRSLYKVIDGLDRRAKDITALNIDQYQELLKQYNMKKVDLIPILEREKVKFQMSYK